MLGVKNANYIFFSTMLLVLFSSFIPIQNITNNFLILLLISQAIVFFPTLLYFIRTKSNYFKCIELHPIKPSTIALLIVFTICVLPVMGFVNAISQLYALNTTSNMLLHVSEHSPYLATLFCVALVPAVLEETVYRGIFYQKYRIVHPTGAIFLSAFLFAILHGNLNQFTYAFFMGIIFALIIEATNSIASTMLIHFIINASSVTAVYLLQKATQIGQQLDKTITNISQESHVMLGDVLSMYAGPAVIGVILSFYIYRAIAKQNSRWEHVKSLFQRNNEDSLKKPSFWSLWSWPLITAVVILVINMILNELILRNIIKL